MASRLQLDLNDRLSAFLDAQDEAPQAYVERLLHERIAERDFLARLVESLDQAGQGMFTKATPAGLLAEIEGQAGG